MSPSSSDWRGVEVDVRRAATPGGRADIGCFSLEGTRIFERALESGVPVEKALISESYRAATSERIRALLAGLEAAGCELFVVPDEVISGLTEGRGNGAILGLVRIPKSPPLTELVAGHSQRPAVFLVGVEIEDPGNVGALVRTARASGTVAFVCVGITDPYHPKAVRTSMGNLFKGPIVRTPDVATLLAELAPLGSKKFGAVSSGGTPLSKARFDAPSIVVFVGSEAFGLSDETLAAMDELVTIPMASEVSSFSVNAAAAVLLYEVRRGATPYTTDG